MYWILRDSSLCVRVSNANRGRRSNCDEVITIGRQEIEEEARNRLETLVKKYELGIGIDQIQLQNVIPPPVQASFNEVNQAQQEREHDQRSKWGV